MISAIQSGLRWLIVPCICLVACSKVTLLRTREIRSVQKDVQELKVEIQKLQGVMGSRFSEQLKTVKEQEASLNRMKADIQALISQLEHQLAMLEGRMEESQRRLETIAEKTDRIDSKEFIIKGAYGGKDSTGQSPRLIVKEKTEVDKLYHLARQDFQRRKFDLAREGFEEIVKNYPNSDIADNAQYGIAECFYAQKEYKKAADHYEKVVKDFPKGNKVPSALFKLGLSHQNEKNTKQMKKAWTQLISKYPGSNEARLAKERLKAKH